MAEIASLIMSFFMGMCFGIVLSVMTRRTKNERGQLHEFAGDGSIKISKAGGGGKNRTRTAATGGAVSSSAKDMGTQEPPDGTVPRP